jgi:hypothetical protein
MRPMRKPKLQPKNLGATAVAPIKTRLICSSNPSLTLVSQSQMISCNIPIAESDSGILKKSANDRSES